MGWNSWNKFGCNITEKIIKDAANAMVNSGLKNAGYEYIVIDDCWQSGRDSMGFIMEDPKRFPSGIKSLADYIHSKGLKFGIYTCAGRFTCGKRPGSRGYEFQDALTYSNWGVDFLKMDWCNTEGQNAKESYSLMRDALYHAGRPIVFSLCEWGLNKPWEWAQEVGHMARTTGDIQNNWNIVDAKEGKCWAGGVVVNLDMQQGLEMYARPGYWNDPDMLEVGNGIITENESRAHFSLWCMLAAPLMTGNDLSNMDNFTKNILTNSEIIAIDQDGLGRQGYKIKDYGEFEIYYKLLENDEAAICLFNRFDENIQIEINWSTMNCRLMKDKKIINLTEKINRKEIIFNQEYFIRDLWKKENIGTTKKSFSKTIQPHDVVVLKFTTIKKK